ncbi:hypothetical protein GBF38_006592 [Nibea albiflora]|uniref:Uncharacterized protein n=1 Tax=Nibea albiflora TaxID=240163 RepID=A0ACB7EGN4_NIBAL|nr:hypothetical protein GBF38_006592 [Nibea albiflora]
MPHHSPLSGESLHHHGCSDIRVTCPNNDLALRAAGCSHRDYVQVLDSLWGRLRDYVQVLDSLRGRHRDYVQVLDSLRGRHRDYVQVLDSLRGRLRDYVQVLDSLRGRHRDYVQVLDSLRGRHRDYVQVLDSLRGRHRDYVQVLDSLRGRHRDYVQVLDSLRGRHRDYVQVLDGLRRRHRDYVQVLDGLRGRHRDYVQVLDSLRGRHRDYVQVLDSLQRLHPDHALNSPVYRYVVTHTPSRPVNTSSSLLPFDSRFAFHRLDAMSFFGALESVLGKPPSDTDRKFQALIRRHLVNFATTGKMADEWPTYPAATALLSDSLSTAESYSAEKCRLWKENGLFAYAWTN